MGEGQPHRLNFSDEYKKAMTRAAALLNKDGWNVAVGVGMSLVQRYSEEYVKGNTEALFLSPKIAELLKNNPDFFNALCEDGVIEWMTPFVLSKSSNLHP